MYSIYFHFRAKNSGGSVIKTFSPASGVSVLVEFPNYRQIWLERELIDYSTSNYYVGQKQEIEVTLTYENNTIPAASGYHELLTTINSITAGGYYEYNIVDSTPTGTNWVACEIVSYRIRKPARLNTAVEVKLTLISRSLV